jgi:GR25 family glycosyltransferase involved in LPS biosynthesis
MDINALVISLKRSDSRKDNVQKIIDSCPVPCRVWEATDGSLLPADRVAAVYQPRLHHPRYPFALTPGEIGCFFSHRRIWQSMVDNAIPQLLILEDDIELLPNFEESLRYAIFNRPANAFVQFQVRELQMPSSDSVSKHLPILVKPVVVPLRTSAQLVTLEAAKRLLEFSEKFDRPIDSMVQLTWLHEVNVFVSQPRCVIEVSDAIGGSTIMNSRKRTSFLKTIRREFDRTFYRCLVARNSRKQAA